VEALSRRLPGDDRTWHQRRADAFTTIVALGADSGELPRHGRTKPHVSVTLTLDQLTGIDNAGPLLARFGRIPVESARRLACDAVLTRIITDSRGHVLDVGRASRHTTTAQNTALAAMHTTCGYPNCDVPLARCDIHHVTWWSRGGPTDLDNLVPLCKQHHWFVHESGYTITTAHHHPERQASTGPRGWRFLTPNGHPIPDHRTILKHHLQQLSLIQHLPEPILMPQEAPKPVTTPGPVTGPRRHLCPELPGARGPG
jgi:hypothetical protein